MKQFIVLLSVLALASCDKSTDRYELVKSEKGVIRLDRQTGQMVAVNERFQASPVKLPVEDDRTPPTQPMYLGVFDLPECPKQVKISTEVRWFRGRLDYRVTATPAIAALGLLNTLEGTESFSIILLDQQGYTISSIEPWFWRGHEGWGKDAGTKSLTCEDSIEMTANDWHRIADSTFSWHFSEATKKALAETR